MTHKEAMRDYIRELINSDDVDVDIETKKHGVKIRVEPKRKCSYEELRRIAIGISDAIFSKQDELLEE